MSPAISGSFRYPADIRAPLVTSSIQYRNCFAASLKGIISTRRFIQENSITQEHMPTMAVEPDDTALTKDTEKGLLSVSDIVLR